MVAWVRASEPDNEADVAALDEDTEPLSTAFITSPLNDAVATDNCVVCDVSEPVVAFRFVLKATGLPIPAIVDDWIFVLDICTTPESSTFKISPASATPDADTNTAVSKILY